MDELPAPKMPVFVHWLNFTTAPAFVLCLLLLEASCSTDCTRDSDGPSWAYCSCLGNTQLALLYRITHDNRTSSLSQRSYTTQGSRANDAIYRVLAVPSPSHPDSSDTFASLSPYPVCARFPATGFQSQNARALPKLQWMCVVRAFLTLAICNSHRHSEIPHVCILVSTNHMTFPAST